MKMRLFLSSLIMASALPHLAFAQTFGAQEFMLKNGMQVVVIPNHRAPVVTQMIWMKVGGSDNTPGRSGMAHYFEHLMFKGTPSVGPGEFSKIVKTLGGDDNAFTGQDYTAFHESVSVDNLPRVMEMDADRLVHLNPPPDHYKSEKAVVLEERRQRTDNDPRAIFSEQMNSALFVNHPYGTPVIGWMDEIKKYEWPDVKTYYDTWYAPNNAILVVSGDITAEQLKPLAEKYYGGLPKKIIPARIRPHVPPALGETLLQVHDDSIHQPMYQKIFLAPSEHTNRKDALALEVLSDILDGGPTTRLYKSLVVDQKKAVNVDFSYNSTALDYGTLSLGGIPADGVTAAEIGALLNTEIRKIIDQGVSDAEVKDAIQRLRDEAVFARDSVSGPAMIFGAALATGSTVADVENWPDDIAKVTPAQVQSVAAKYLNDAKPWIRPGVAGYLLPSTDALQPVKEPSAKDSKPAASPEKGKTDVQG